MAEDGWDIEAVRFHVSLRHRMRLAVRTALCVAAIVGFVGYGTYSAATGGFSVEAVSSDAPDMVQLRGGRRLQGTNMSSWGSCDKRDASSDTALTAVVGSSECPDELECVGRYYTRDTCDGDPYIKMVHFNDMLEGNTKRGMRDFGIDNFNKKVEHVYDGTRCVANGNPVVDCTCCNDDIEGMECLTRIVVKYERSGTTGGFEQLKSKWESAARSELIATKFKVKTTNELEAGGGADSKYPLVQEYAVKDWTADSTKTPTQEMFYMREGDDHYTGPEKNGDGTINHYGAYFRQLGAKQT
eukprot:g1231.t1